jgi:hypothetical protein
VYPRELQQADPVWHPTPLSHDKRRCGPASPTVTSLAILIVLFVLTGCAAVALKESRPTQPGLEQSPSSPHPKAIVLGNFPSAIAQAVMDLAALGITVIDRARVEDAFERQHVRPARVSDEQLDPMKIGRQLGADVVVFLDVVAGRRPTYCETAPCANVYSPFVSARAFSTRTGHILWSGRAHSNATEAHLDAEIRALTHEAIAEATVDWSPRPSRLAE